jgi:hypothetical protein
LGYHRQHLNILIFQTFELKENNMEINNVYYRETAESTPNIVASKSEKDPLLFNVTGTNLEGLN